METLIAVLVVMLVVSAVSTIFGIVLAPVREDDKKHAAAMARLAKQAEQRIAGLLEALETKQRRELN